MGAILESSKLTKTESMMFLVSRLLIKTGFQTILMKESNTNGVLQKSEACQNEKVTLSQNIIDQNVGSNDDYSIEEETKKSGGLKSDYESICGLIGHFSKRNEKVQFLQLYSAVGIVTALSKSKLFIPPDHKSLCDHSCTENMNDCCFQCLITIICSTVKHIEQIFSNGFSITRIKCCRAKNEKISWNKKVLGSGLYHSLSIFNHSCDPNVYPFFYQDMVVVRTIHPIKAGQELCTSYAEYFACCDKVERQKRLEEHYCFTCDCPACKFNWPKIEIPPSLTPEEILVETIFQCSYCGYPISKSDICHGCGMKFDMEKAKQKLIEVPWRDDGITVNTIIVSLCNLAELSGGAPRS